MNKMLEASQITTLFGKGLNDDDVIHLYKELNTIVLPTIKPEDEDEDDIPRYHDWVLVRRKGIELGFSEYHYQTGSDFDLWGEGELLLTQAYFYSGGESIESFTGELPYGISFSDTRDNVKHKLTKFEQTKRSYLSDTWDVDGYRLNVKYNNNNLISMVACIQQPNPLRHDQDLVQPTLMQVTDYLGLTQIDTNFTRLWSNSEALAIAQINSINQKRYLSLKRSHGVYLKFAIKSDAILLKSITFYSDHEDEAVAWQGDLPFGLSFDDDMAMLLNKIGEKPVKIIRFWPYLPENMEIFLSLRSLFYIATLIIDWYRLTSPKAILDIQIEQRMLNRQ